MENEIEMSIFGIKTSSQNLYRQREKFISDKFTKQMIKDISFPANETLKTQEIK